MLSDLVNAVIQPSFGIGIQDYILLVTILGLFIFYAIDLRIGLLIQFVSLALMFIAFHAISWPTQHVLLALLATLVLLALSLFVSYQKTRGSYS